MKKLIYSILVYFLGLQAVIAQDSIYVYQRNISTTILKWPISSVDSVSIKKPRTPCADSILIHLQGANILKLANYNIDSISFSRPTSPLKNGTEFTVGQIVTTTSLLSGNSYKGTLLAGQTYTFNGPITINVGDTLVMQSGVKLLATDPSAMILVYGSFISLGTEANPNWITGLSQYNNPSVYKLTVPTNTNLDPALNLGISKAWYGIQCDTNCKLLVIKWTHIEFVGNVANSSIAGILENSYAVGDNMFGILFQNYNGNFILEDSWIYGTSGDAVRVKSGKIHFMRNTLEKVAHDDGDALNVKGGTIGDMAYNLFLGTAKGGTKAASTGQPIGSPQTFINMYNNTYINGGWRTTASDRGSDIDYESAAAGNAFNNIIVNCFTGLRVLSNPPANTQLMQVGNNLTYGDSINVLGQIYPPGKYLFAPTSDIPNPSNWYPGYANGTPIAVATTVLGIFFNPATITGLTVGANNPKFVNYQLPLAPLNGSLDEAFNMGNYVGTYDFHLQCSSPAVGAGNTSAFTPVDATNAITHPALKANVTPPNIDLGAFPTDGSGNRHTLVNSR